MVLDILTILLFVFGLRFLFLMCLERRRDVLYRIRRTRKAEQAENDREGTASFGEKWQPAG